LAVAIVIPAGAPVAVVEVVAVEPAVVAVVEDDDFPQAASKKTPAPAKPAAARHRDRADRR